VFKIAVAESLLYVGSAKTLPWIIIDCVHFSVSFLYLLVVLHSDSVDRPHN
jgi:hypothetical protein